MTAIYETAYRELKSSYTKKELEDIFTPNKNELEFVLKSARIPLNRLAVLVHIKVLNQIGRFRKLDEVPISVVRYLLRFLPKCVYESTKFLKLDSPANRNRLLNVTRKYTSTSAYNKSANEIANTSALEASKTKEKIPDIINIVLEELIRNRYELPGFTSLVKIANSKRKEINDGYFNKLFHQLDKSVINKFDNLLITENSENSFSDWHRLKMEPGKPSNKVLRNFIEHFSWLKNWTNSLPNIGFIPVSKRRQFMLEARALDAGNLKRVKSNKRYSLITILFYSQQFSATDDLVNLFLKKISSLHASGMARLRKFQIDKLKQTEKLIKQLRDVLNAYQSSESDHERIENITSSLLDEPDVLLSECEEHIAYSDGNYFPFLLSPYIQARSLIFNCLSLLNLNSTTNDNSIVKALDYVLKNQNTRKEFYPTDDFNKDVGIDNLHWMPKKWKKLTVINKNSGFEVKRKYFELCLFSQIANEFKSLDLVVNDSNQYCDLEPQLVSLDEYEEQIDDYCEMLEFPSNPKEFVSSLKGKLRDISRNVDNSYNENKGFYLDDKGLHIRKPRKIPDPDNLKQIEDIIRKRLKNRSILDIITDVEAWTNIHSQFGPLSGFKAKMKDQRLRFITTLFCYGFNLGPTQTAQSVLGLTRKQVAWSNQRHITEENIDLAIINIINTYNRYILPNFWGDGKSVSADGTMWNVYERNLLSEYHIRYGAYGGIGYYHVSDNYIALFSHFIPCGVYEAVYILDGLIKNKSDIQPNIVHGDTHAQSFTVFGLSHLLGIELMPRIRDIKNLIFYRHSKNEKYLNIDNLFQDKIDWDLIERHIPDMLRIALSIKAGNVEPSAILRKLGNSSRKNRLYFAFRELGRVQRTIFLLKYISDIDLRKTINAETNKCEQFNDYIKWLFFGNNGVIAENLRHKQSKISKYSHLVANMVILYNVEHMTRTLSDLKNEGYKLDKTILSKLNPYRKSNINRYGSYNLKMRRKTHPMSFDTPIL